MQVQIYWNYLDPRIYLKHHCITTIIKYSRQNDIVTLAWLFRRLLTHNFYKMFKNSEEQSKENFCKEMNQSSAKNTFSYTSTLKLKSLTAKSELTEELVAKNRFIFPLFY